MSVLLGVDVLGCSPTQQLLLSVRFAVGVDVCGEPGCRRRLRLM